MKQQPTPASPRHFFDDMLAVRFGHDEAALGFAEQRPGVMLNLAIDMIFERVDHQPSPDVPGQRHFGNRDQRAAIGDIVNRGHQAFGDQQTDEFRVAPLGVEIDARRRPSRRP